MIEVRGARQSFERMEKQAPHTHARVRSQCEFFKGYEFFGDKRSVLCYDEKNISKSLNRNITACVYVVRTERGTDILMRGECQMFCSNCGKEIDDDARFCEHCGMPIFTNLTEEKLRQFQALQAAFRGAQPKEQPEKPRPAGGPVCPACGRQLPKGSRFCGFCGRGIAL